MKKTIFVSSHLLNEIEQVATRVLIIDKGRKVVEGKMSELFDPEKTTIELQVNNIDEVYEKLKHSELKQYLSGKQGNYIVFHMHRNLFSVLVKNLVQMNIEIISLSSKQSLENYFLSLTTENQHVESFKD